MVSTETKHLKSFLITNKRNNKYTMGIIKLRLTEDHLHLIRNIKFTKFKHTKTFESDEDYYGWGIDQLSLFGGDYVLEEIAHILGRMDEYIKGSEELTTGRAFSQETTDYFYELYEYIVDNLEWIEDLIHFNLREGIKPGTYKCIDTIKVWEFVEEK